MYATIRAGVGAVICLSTNAAAYPISSKAVEEKFSSGKKPLFRSRFELRIFSSLEAVKTNVESVTRFTSCH